MRAIVFVLRGLPAGWLGAYGNDWVGTPHLDRLAAEGVVFDRHISDRPGRPTPPGPPSLKGKGEKNLLDSSTSNGAREATSIVTPLPFREGGVGPPRTLLVRANHPDTDAPPSYYAGWGEVFDARPQPEDDSPLAELLRIFPELLDRLADVPDFLLWVETDRLIPPWDVQQDVFEAYLDDADEDEPTPGEEDTPDEAEDVTNGGGDESDGDDGDEYVNEDEEFVEDADDSSLPTPHSSLVETVPPFADPPTGPFDRADLDAWDYLHRTFAAVVTKLDAELGLLFEDLRARGLDRSAAWAVTSDFGLPLGEHGQVGLHRPWLHEELVHLPLILRLPGAEQSGRRVPGFTQPPDLLPTLRALLGLPPEAGLGAFDLLPLARGADSPRPFAVTQMELNGAAEMAIRTAEWALLVPTRAAAGDPPREPLLFGKPDDRWEVNDLRPRNVERADELEAKLRAAGT
jgi:arylsulfatase A-like enzyme